VIYSTEMGVMESINFQVLRKLFEVGRSKLNRVCITVVLCCHICTSMVVNI